MPVAAIVAVAFALALCGAVAGAWGWHVIADDDRDSPTTSALATPATAATSAPAPTTPTPAIDDAAALSNLGMAIGALYAYAESQTPEDCSYVAHTATIMSGATPLDSYRGTYESIQQRMANVGALCSADPRDPLAVAEARSTRVDVVKILNDRAYLGMTDWG